MRVADVVEEAARSLPVLAVDVPVCWRAFRPSLGGLLAVVGCWVHRGSLGSLAVLVPVAVGAGVPVCMPVGLRVLCGLGRGFALRVGGGLPPRRRGCTVPVSCAPVCASALAVAAAASSTARRAARSLHLAAAAARRRRLAGRRPLHCPRGCVAGQWGSDVRVVIAVAVPAVARELAALAG